MKNCPYDECNVQFSETSAYKHLRGHIGSGSKNVECPHSGCGHVEKDNGTRMPDHIMSKHLGLGFPCPAGCGKAFIRRDLICRHRRSKCTICMFCKVQKDPGLLLQNHEKMCETASEEERANYKYQLAISESRKRIRRENKARKEAAA